MLISKSDLFKTTNGKIEINPAVSYLTDCNYTIKNIVFFESIGIGNQCHLMLNNNRLKITYDIILTDKNINLTKILQELNDPVFFKAKNDLILNKNFIDSIAKKYITNSTNISYFVKLKTGDEIEVSPKLIRKNLLPNL